MQLTVATWNTEGACLKRRPRIGEVPLLVAGGVGGRGAARRKQAARRGGEFIRVDDAEIDEFPSNKNLDDLVAINEILEKLAEIDPRKAQLVKLRYFVGMTGEEVAETMDMSLTTVNRDWAFARAWLYKELNK